MFDFDLTVPLLPREIALKVANAQRATVFLDTIVQVANLAQVGSPSVHATARTLDVALRSQFTMLGPSLYIRNKQRLEWPNSRQMLW